MPDSNSFFFLTNLAYFLFQKTIMYEEIAVTALWEAIASQQEEIKNLKADITKIQKDVNNKRVVYLRPPKK